MNQCMMQKLFLCIVCNVADGLLSRAAGKRAASVTAGEWLVYVAEVANMGRDDHQCFVPVLGKIVDEFLEKVLLLRSCCSCLACAWCFAARGFGICLIFIAL